MADGSTKLAGREARVLVENVKDYAILQLDAQGRVQTWNEGARLIKGYEADEILGRHVSTFHTPEDVAAGRPERLLATAAREGRVEDEGYRVRKDGSRFFADVVITAVLGRDGTLRGYVKVTRDLTERKETEERLRQSEERMRLLIDSVQDYAIFMLDPEGRIVTWNPGAERTKGYTADEVRGKHVSLFYTPEDVAAGRPERLLAQAAREGRVEVEGYRVRKDGSRFFADVVISAMRDEQGKLLGFTKVARDLTERRRAEEATATRARQQKAVAELGLFALQTMDLQRIFDRVSTLAAATLDVELGCVLELLPPGDKVVLRAGTGFAPADIGQLTIPLAPDGGPRAFVRDALTFDDLETDSRIKSKDWLRERGVKSGAAVFLHGPDETTFGFLAVYAKEPRSFSEDDLHFLRASASIVAAAISRARIEAARREAEAQAHEERLRSLRAEEAVRERDEFISVAAHELRTPLTALQLKLQSLDKLMQRTEREPIPAPLGARLEAALRQTERLADLVERLLDVTRMRADRLELCFEEANVGDVIDEAVEELREQARVVGSSLHVEVPHDVHVRWDQRRMVQVIRNLLSNALKYGGGTPVSVHAEVAQDTVRLSVSDQGIGIPPDDLPRIFDRFERAASAQNFGGLGLGLYITRKIVEAHGGTIRAESEPGKGATFLLELPVTPAGAQPAAHDASAPDARTA